MAVTIESVNTAVIGLGENIQALTKELHEQNGRQRVASETIVRIAVNQQHIVKHLSDHDDLFKVLQEDMDEARTASSRWDKFLAIVGGAIASALTWMQLQK